MMTTSIYSKSSLGKSCYKEGCNSLSIDNAQVLNKTSKINKETHRHLTAHLYSTWKVCHVGSSDLRKTPTCYVERTLFAFDN
jgi:hypothetical protein